MSQKRYMYWSWNVQDQEYTGTNNVLYLKKEEAEYAGLLSGRKYIIGEVEEPLFELSDEMTEMMLHSSFVRMAKDTKIIQLTQFLTHQN